MEIPKIVTKMFKIIEINRYNKIRINNNFSSKDKISEVNFINHNFSSKGLNKIISNKIIKTLIRI